MTDPTHDDGLHQCRGSVEELYQYLDGWLDDDTGTRVRHQIESCADCEDIYRFHAQLRVVIGVTCRTEVPDAVRRRIISAIIEL